MDREELELLARQIRYYSLKCIASAGSGHVGGVLSMADLMAVLYGDVMRLVPDQPDYPDRDRCVMSKGHCGPAQYAALALRGFFPLDELDTLNQGGTRLPSHCNKLTPGIDMSTGSLGQGASMAAGIALALKKKHSLAYTYLILGDGECDEGQVWEAALFAAHHCLDHLIAFVDLNKQQLDGYTKEVLDLGDLSAKFRAFAWDCQRINGHDVIEIKEAIEKAKKNISQPSVILLDTVKGKGWSKSEGKPNVHHMTVSQEEVDSYLHELALQGGIQ